MTQTSESYALHWSFSISYIILMGLTIVTFIEALRTTNPKVRHILNLETTVSFIASIVYGIFLKILHSHRSIDLSEITKYRYMDWYITTPLLLLVLLLFFNFYNKKPLPVSLFAFVVLCNFFMLLMGHLGEANKIDKQKALYAGFAFYMLLMGIIWFHLLHESDIHHHKLIFLVFAIVWAMYGIAYTLDEKTKNIMYNFLDVISKAMFGIFMWIYYGNVFAFA